MEIISQQDARSAASAHYFTGSPCKNGHLSPRYTSNGMCIECSIAYRKLHYKNNKAHYQENKKRWSDDNPHKMREYRRKWRIKNPDQSRQTTANWASRNKKKKLANNIRWNKENAERCKRNSKSWYQKNRDRVLTSSSRWKKEHPVAVRTWAKRRRGFLLNGSHTANDIFEILNSQKHRCAYCRIKIKGVNFHVDHIKAISKGGMNDRKNLQILCIKCNLEKSIADPIDFARSRVLLV
jgi:5-methylcytosine-specific restriction endonuclease McrA